jgi:hypothetical protein
MSDVIDDILTPQEVVEIAERVELLNNLINEKPNVRLLLIWVFQSRRSIEEQGYCSMGQVLSTNISK